MFIGEYLAAVLEVASSECAGRYWEFRLLLVVARLYFCLLYGSASSIGMSPSRSPLWE